MANIIPSFWRFPIFASDLWEDVSSMLPTTAVNGLSVSEDEKNVYIEAAVPGIDPKDVEVTFDKGVLWVKGEKNEEEKKGKKYYRKATSSFSYQVAVPSSVDWKEEPDAVCKHGVMHVTFSKSPAVQPKKITVKTA